MPCRGRSILLCSLLLLAGAMTAPGCKGTQQKDEAESADWVALGAPAPVSSSATRGLEVQMLVVTNIDHSVSRVLAPYDNAGDLMSVEERAQWRSWGLRWCAVPIEEVNGMLARLSPVQPARVQWLGEFSHWRAVVRAGTIAEQRVRTDKGETLIKRGKPRLIARSWIQPMMDDEGVRPGVRTDLALQMELPRADRMIWALDVEGLPMIDDDGPVLGELLTGVHADGKHALVLVADSPDRDWGNLPSPLQSALLESDQDTVGPTPTIDAAESEETDDAVNASDVEDAAETQSAPERSVAASGSSRAIGPVPEIRPTLGELMFTTRGSGPKRAGGVYDPPRSVVIVLIPRVEGGYGLLPSIPTDGNTD